MAEASEPQLKPVSTTPFLTKYERARVLGVRSLQISMGAPVKINVDPHITDPVVIAEQELEQKAVYQMVNMKMSMFVLLFSK